VRVCTPRLASGAKNPEFGAEEEKIKAFRAKKAGIGAGRRNNQPIRAKNQLNGAAASETSYYSAEIPAE